MFVGNSEKDSAGGHCASGLECQHISDNYNINTYANVSKQVWVINYHSYLVEGLAYLFKRPMPTNHKQPRELSINSNINQARKSKSVGLGTDKNDRILFYKY